jgi:hypothetical protein
VLSKPSKPALPFRQQLSPFLGTPGLFLIPLREIEPGVLARLSLILAIHRLLDIQMIEQMPAN